MFDLSQILTSTNLAECGIVKLVYYLLREQCPSQCQPHPPSSRERLSGPCLHLRREAQPTEDNRRTGRRFVRFYVLQLSVHLTQFIRQAWVCGSGSQIRLLFILQ